MVLVGGESYNDNDQKQNIVMTRNQLGKAITDIGLIAASVTTPAPLLRRDGLQRDRHRRWLTRATSGSA